MEETSTPIATSTATSTATPAPTPAATPVPTPECSTSEQLPGAAVGDIVTFGHYEQDNDTSNGKEAIEWQVLAVDGDKILVISRYGLDTHRFDENYYLGWNKSEMRSWLNSTFLNEAFTAEEQARIVTTTVSTPSYRGKPGGSDVEDKIWLLSREEVSSYFTSEGDRKTLPTEYAVARGAYQSDKLIGAEYCWWWLRSPGLEWSDASIVNSAGVLSISAVKNGIGVVRPAMWVSLESDVFQSYVKDNEK